MKKELYKYQEIALELEKRISSGLFAEDKALPSETVLAKEFGVNHLTFRKAMDLLVRNGRISRRRGKGTFILKTIDSNSNISIDDTSILYAGDTESDFFKELYTAVVGESQKAGYRLFPCNTSTAKFAEIRKSISQASCIICDKNTMSMIEKGKLSVAKKNLICLDIYYEGRETVNAYEICSDVFQATRLTTEYFIESGYEKIAFISASDNWNEDKSFRQPSKNRRSYLGFHSAFTSHSSMDLMSSCLGIGEKTIEKNAELIFKWLKSLDNLPDAFVCEGDYRAAALIRAASKLGMKNPDDFGVTGTGNTKWCEMLTPSLSSVYMGEKEMAELAVALADKDAPNSRRLFKTEPKLIIRDSSPNRNLKYK